MKTLADLKRDIVGKQLILIERDGKTENILRTVIAVKSNEIVLQKTDGNKSYLEIPKATLLDYDGKTIKIYNAGNRDLNKEEQMIKDNEPKDEKQDERDMLSDGSTMFHRREHYYKEKGYEYLFGGSKKIQGKRLTHDNHIPKIRDDAIKGKISLIYEIQG